MVAGCEVLWWSHFLSPLAVVCIVSAVGYHAGYWCWPFLFASIIVVLVQLGLVLLHSHSHLGYGLPVFCWLHISLIFVIHIFPVGLLPVLSIVVRPVWGSGEGGLDALFLSFGS